jgi:hypothetical protein
VHKHNYITEAKKKETMIEKLNLQKNETPSVNLLNTSNFCYFEKFQ